MQKSLRQLACLLMSAVLVMPVPGVAQTQIFSPNNLVVSRSVYSGNSTTVTVGQTLPPNCVPGTVMIPLIGGGTTNVTIPNNSSSGCNTAVADGTYPTVFNNAHADGSFGVTSPIFLDQMTTGGVLLNSLAIDSSRIVTSFSSKSELALNLSDDRASITFAGYVGGPGYLTAPNQLDVSNSNTPGVVDPSNPVSSQYYRAVAEVDASGDLQITDGNAYSGNNGRAAIKAKSTYYMTGNGNNGGLSTTQLMTTQVGVNLVTSTGAEIVVPGQAPPLPPNIDMIGNFSVTQVGYPTADKPGKDNNFRGLTIFNNTLYVSKGSGGNGINTVYQVGTSSTLPSPATTPGGNLNVPITILPGFPTTLASGVALDGSTGNPVSFPFGLWFANATTLYVADEGDGTLVSPPVNGNVATPQTLATAGLQKWVFNPSSNMWQRVYILQNGLGLGFPYNVANGPEGEVYPIALNPATDGLRNITGQVNADGTVSIWAITSTVSASGDQGADPNRLVTITDVLANTDPTVAAKEQFSVLSSAGYGEVLRGVCFTPGTTTQTAPPMPVTVSGLAYSRVSRTYTGTMTMTNNSSAPIEGPIYVLLENLPAGVTLTNASTTLLGNPAVLMLPSGTAMSPGQSTSANIAFSNPSNVRITFTPVPFAPPAN